MTERVGVLLMAYGTPLTIDAIEPYYTDIRRGRPPTAEALAELTNRYAAIGGLSPLAELTEAQRDALQDALDLADPDRYHVKIGLKHADPKIETAAAELASSECSTIVGLVLAPHFSEPSIGQYLERARQGAAADSGNVSFVGIESWATEPALIDFLAADLKPRIDEMRSVTGQSVRVLFTAHSLPARTIQGGDRYPDELRSTASAIADRLGLVENDDWQIAWQSAGRTPEPWIGPDILEVIDQLAADRSVGGMIVCACGFVADHLEVLYDLDIEAAGRAEQQGLAFDRTSSVNADSQVVTALAERVRLAVEVQHQP